MDVIIMKYPTAKLIITHVDGSTDEIFASLETPPGKYTNDADVAHDVTDAFYDHLNEIMKVYNRRL